MLSHSRLLNYWFDLCKCLYLTMTLVGDGLHTSPLGLRASATYLNTFMHFNGYVSLFAT